uniref:Uncharacterized protein n=1 Tax=Anguilla anguilla TaxID=7936 RepID=A0A0E9PSZ1_ANGAN
MSSAMEERSPDQLPLRPHNMLTDDWMDSCHVRNFGWLLCSAV